MTRSSKRFARNSASPTLVPPRLSIGLRRAITVQRRSLGLQEPGSAAHLGDSTRTLPGTGNLRTASAAAYERPMAGPKSAAPRRSSRSPRSPARTPGESWRSDRLPSRTRPRQDADRHPRRRRWTWRHQRADHRALVLFDLAVGAAIVLVLAAVGAAAVRANLRPLNDIELSRRPDRPGPPRPPGSRGRSAHRGRLAEPVAERDADADRAGVPCPGGVGAGGARVRGADAPVHRRRLA